MSTSSDIPLSTLKLNAQVLKQLNLIEFGENSSSRAAKLTEGGRTLLEILSNGGEKHELS